VIVTVIRSIFRGPQTLRSQFSLSNLLLLTVVAALTVALVASQAQNATQKQEHLSRIEHLKKSRVERKLARQKLILHIHELELLRAQLAPRFGQSHPKVKEIDASLDQYKGAIFSNDLQIENKLPNLSSGKF